jgi:NAD(P)H-flavin reductase
MNTTIHPFDIKKLADMRAPVDFNQRNRLMPVEKNFKAQIAHITPLTDREKLFHIRILDAAERQRFTFLPGQFVMLEVPGFGEIPVSIAGDPSIRGYIELCIRKAGTVTGVLHSAQPGARVGIRGPFGTHFPMDQMVGSDVLLIAGGLGLAPLRAPIFHVTQNRPDYRSVHILYGTADPVQLLFDFEYEQWNRIYGCDLQIIVERPDDAWTGHVGMITKLFDAVDVDPDETYAIVCGPPVMFKFICNKLSDMGVPMHRIYVSLERRMHCGMGKCCRCNIGSTYTCIGGPVFDYWTVMNLKESI